MSATQSRQVSSQGVIASSGWKSEPRERLREEVRALLRHALAAPRDGEHVVDPRRPEEERDVGVAAVDEPPTASSRRGV